MTLDHNPVAHRRYRYMLSVEGGGFIRQTREALCWTRGALAEVAGVRESALVRWEKPTPYVHPRSMSQLFEAFHEGHTREEQADHYAEVTRRLSARWGGVERAARELVVHPATLSSWTSGRHLPAPELRRELDRRALRDLPPGQAPQLTREPEGALDGWQEVRELALAAGWFDAAHQLHGYAVRLSMARAGLHGAVRLSRRPLPETAFGWAWGWVVEEEAARQWWQNIRPRHEWHAQQDTLDVILTPQVRELGYVRQAYVWLGARREAFGRNKCGEELC